jgi:septal ring factor EnvC (AmiA/AmiB activator)
MFVAAIEDTPPVLTTENMNDFFILCKEFVFASLLSQVSDFIARHRVADEKARKRISDLEAKNREQDRKLSLLQKDVLDLRRANKSQMQDIAEIREGRSRLAGENASWRRRAGYRNKNLADLVHAGKV